LPCPHHEVLLWNRHRRTFTDCAASTAPVDHGRCGSTPDYLKAFQRWSLRGTDRHRPAAARYGHLFLGTTVGTNALLQMKGARTGLITTRHWTIWRSCAGGASAGLPIERLLHVRGTRAAAAHPAALIREVSERIDWKGAVFLPLNEREVEQAATELLAEGVDAIAVCLLWSISNPAHEQRIREILGRVAPGVFVSCSHELIAKRGEYERAVGTAINCFIGPAMTQSLRDIEARATKLGYRKPILVLQVTGGVVPSREVSRTPLYTISSGPAAGVTGSLFLASAMARRIVITDMRHELRDRPYLPRHADGLRDHHNQYVPDAPPRSIGSGGGRSCGSRRRAAS
jgi:N-methylhydantoinase A